MLQIENTTNTINAFCECCDSEVRADKSSLENCGWWVGQNEQFCPECNN